MLSSIRLVWNLTNSCPFNCSFCAASANSCAEIPTSDKFAILNSISSVDIPVALDFAGGDPLYCIPDIEIIETAVQLFGRENIEISTTGLSLSHLSDELIQSLASGYALTYDFPKDFMHLDPRRSIYSYHNYYQILRLQKLEIPFEVVLPVRYLQSDVVQALVDDLIKFQSERIALLQMMPLGNNQSQEVAYLHSEVNQLIHLLHAGGYGGKITTSCAFRGECNAMTERKFGLDMYGNLFGCIWAADLKIPLSDNQFYLGNLLDRPLQAILQENAKKFHTLPRNFCYAIEQSQTLATS